jgi:hypothetical protein
MKWELIVKASLTHPHILAMLLVLQTAFSSFASLGEPFKS